MIRPTHRLAIVLVLVAIAAAGLVGGPAHGQAAGSPAVVQAEAKATGPTAEVALRRALADAVRRVESARGAGQPERAAAREAALSDTLADLDAALAAEGNSVASITAEIKRLSRGLIDRVAVAGTRLVGTETEVSALVWVAALDARTASRKTLAVMPFRASNVTFPFAGTPIPNEELLRRLTTALVERLVRSGTVTVLDRSFTDSFVTERNFVESFGRTPDELARFGRMLGADLLLVGSLENAGLETRTETVQASGYTISQSFAGMVVSARLVDTASGAIVWADTIRTSLSNAQLARMFGPGPADVGGTLTALVEETADGIAGELVATIAPIKVALVEGDAIWLNRGTGRLAAGDRLLVRGGGADVIDPDTGESLGRSERTVAVIEVVATDPRKSQARLIEGRVEDIAVGQAARPMAAPGS